MFSLFVKSLKEFFTPKFLKLTIIPFVGTILVLALIYFRAQSSAMEAGSEATITLNQSSTTLYNGKPQEHTTQVELKGLDSIMAYLLQSDMGVWLQGYDFVGLALSLLTQLSIFIAVIIISFMTPTVVRMIGEKHYPTLEVKGFESYWDLGWMLFKSVSIMIILFFVLIPLYFIPFVNTIALHIPLYYFFHKMLVFDVGSTMMGRFDYARMKLGASRDLRVTTLISYLISQVPFVGAFLSLFFIIWLTFTQFNILEQIRHES
jgi:hypothetical protein